MVDENAQIAFVLYADELSAVARIQQRGRPVLLSRANRSRAKDTKTVILLRRRTKNAGQVFIAVMNTFRPVVIASAT